MYSFQIPLLPIKLLDISIGVLEGWVDFALFFPLETTRKAGGLQILSCQGIAVSYYGFTLDALTLKPSDFCNVGGVT
jgi:hypothetical protein